MYFLSFLLALYIDYDFRNKLEMRSVERGICIIASSTMNELLLQLSPDALRMHEMAIFPLPV